jgi:Bacteriocin-protection, YdeI or OmpD-Associated
MPTTTAQKLRIQEGFTLLAIHAPADFQEKLQPLPPSVKILTTSKKCNQVHWFVEDKARLEKELNTILPLVKNEVTCWIYYPKGTSKMQTDLTRDKGWDALLSHNDTLTWINLISFDEIWSVFGFRLKTEADRKKAEQPKERPIFEYIDAKTKTIRLPDDLAAALKNNKKQELFFNTLSFTNRKEYVEWIVTAKRAETRTQRIKGTIEKLGKEWKNPANL